MNIERLDIENNYDDTFDIIMRNNWSLKFCFYDVVKNKSAGSLIRPLIQVTLNETSSMLH